MPLVKPKAGEKKDEFISRCMDNKTMKSEYPDNDQRLAVCYSQWDKEKDNKNDADLGSKLERRYLTMELRLADTDDGNKKIEGYAARFNTWGEGYGFREKIAPGAFKRTLKDGDDIRALFNHNPDLPLGRTGVKGEGKLTLREDKEGLWMELIPTDTTFARDLKTNIEAGVISQQSFGFEVREDEWTYFNEEKDKPAERILRDVKLYDVSPVTYPFYTDTSVALRSLDKWKIEHGIVDDIKTENEITDSFHDAVESKNINTEVIKEKTSVEIAKDITGLLDKITQNGEIKTNIMFDDYLVFNANGLNKDIVQEKVDNVIESLRSQTIKDENKTIKEDNNIELLQATIEITENNLRENNIATSVDSDVHSPSENNSGGNDTLSKEEILRRRKQFELNEGEYNFNNRYRTKHKNISRY